MLSVSLFIISDHPLDQNQQKTEGNVTKWLFPKRNQFTVEHKYLTMKSSNASNLRTHNYKMFGVFA